MNEKTEQKTDTKPEKKNRAVKTERQTAAKKIQARLDEVLGEIERARATLEPIIGSSKHGDVSEEVVRALDIIEKATVIGRGEDLLEWYQTKAGV